MEINEKQFLDDLERLKRAQKIDNLLEEFLQKLEAIKQC